VTYIKRGISGWVSWHTPVILATQRQRQEDEEFEDILSKGRQTISKRKNTNKRGWEHASSSRRELV
jgi:hypothetical protein